jgi:hypothetical protein
VDGLFNGLADGRGRWKVLCFCAMELAALLAENIGVVGGRGLALLFAVAFAGESSDFGVGEGRGAVGLR